MERKGTANFLSLLDGRGMTLALTIRILTARSGAPRRPSITPSISMSMWEVKDIGDIVQMIAWRRTWGHAVIMGHRVLNVSIQIFVMTCVR